MFLRSVCIQWQTGTTSVPPVHTARAQRSLVCHVQRHGEGIIDVPLALAELMIFTLTVGYAVAVLHHTANGAASHAMAVVTQ